MCRVTILVYSSSMSNPSRNSATVVRQGGVIGHGEILSGGDMLLLDGNGYGGEYTCLFQHHPYQEDFPVRVHHAPFGSLRHLRSWSACIIYARAEYLTPPSENPTRRVCRLKYHTHRLLQTKRTRVLRRLLYWYLFTLFFTHSGQQLVCRKVYKCLVRPEIFFSHSQGPLER